MIDIKELKEKIAGKTIIDQLNILSGTFSGEILFTTSFGIEDQVITHMIFENDLPVEIVTLDTGRLFPETYKVFAETLIRYKKQIKVYFPDYFAVEKMVNEKGPFSFYESVENRLECCHVRKVIPLTRALMKKRIWITGIRAEQSVNRTGMGNLEYDHSKRIIKFHPIFNWSYEDVSKFVTANQIPYNVLHDRGYLSIGCEPCTRAIKPGEDFRGGRWWWETGGTKECGCHTSLKTEGIENIIPVKNINPHENS